MAKKKARKPLYQRLKDGLNEGVEFSKGKLDLRTVEFPEEPPEIDAATVTALRQSSEMSQAVFARLLNVSTKTVQSWEQGTRKPSQASRRLIQIFSLRPEIVCQIAGLTERQLDGVREVKTSRGGKRLIVKRKVRGKKQIV